MEENMIAQRVEHFDSKPQFSQGVIALINSSIGREMDDTENRAIAFMVERKYQAGVAQDVFLRETLGVERDVSPRDAALKIHKSVFEEKLRKIGELMADNPSGSERLKAWKEQIEIGHTATLDRYYKDSNYSPYIGGVSLDWIPAWFH